MSTQVTSRAILLASLLLCLRFPAAADEPRHSFTEGDKFRVLSLVHEDVYVNRRYSHSARIVNRIAFEVADVRADGAGLLRGTFSTSVLYEGGYAYVADQFYDSEYWQLPSGRFEIDSRYFMPVVRHVPTFPAKPIEPGDTWNAPGEERHDLRAGFGIPDPYVIPMDVRYRFQERGTYEGKPVLLIRASYTIFHQPAAPRWWTMAYPVQIAGYSDQLLYWDPERGGIVAYEERFKFVFELNDGQTIEYRGEAGARVVESELMDRGAIEQKLRDAVGDLPDVGISSDERGVTITLEDIRFEPDSARLLPSELAKLASIAQVLKGEPDRHIQVSGHTALAGTADGRMTLSQERARAVAEALISMGVRAAEDITVVGYGAERPVAGNDTEAGRARNRRVEITILEN